MVDLTLPDPSPTPGSTQDTGDAAARLVARVQAWQHRHPLARRLPAADVNGLGVIALPFGEPPAAGGKLQPLFHQPSLVPGLSHRALVEFALRHAVKDRPGPTDWPLREVERADASPDPAPETRYLLTAAITEPIKPGAQPRRLLIAPEGPAIWGPRPLSPRRVAEAVGVLLLILLALGWGQRSRLTGGAPAPAPMASGVQVPPASTAMAAHPASAPASTALAVQASAPHAASSPLVAASVLPVAPASVAARAVPASTPASALPHAAAVASTPRPASAPAKSPSSPAALAASAPTAPASVALPAPPKLLPMPALRGVAASAATAVASAPASVASAAPPAGPHFALVSLPSKKRAGAEETLARVHKVLGPAIGNLQAQIMPSPEGFVVTLWPVPTEADAEQLANVLARRGVQMKWLEF